MHERVWAALTEPEEDSIEFRPAAWRDLLERYDAEWSERPDLKAGVSTVSRVQVHALSARVRSRTTDERAHGILTLFLWSQIWGYGPTGYGPHRVARILDGTTRRVPSVSAREALTSCYETLLDRGPVEAYSLMANKYWVRGFGPAFLTKFLYFGGSACEHSHNASRAPAPLILDALVSRAIKQEYGIKYGPGWGTQRYREYLEFMRREAHERYDVQPDQLERALFEVGKRSDAQ